MAAYTVKALPHIEDDLAKIPEPDRSRISAAIKSLSIYPRQDGSVKMSGYADVHRFRVGKYRIVYTIHDNELVVIVIAVAPRGNIYPLTKRRIGKWKGGAK